MDTVYERLIVKALSQLPQGRLELTAPTGQVYLLGQGSEEPTATMRVNNRAAFRAIVLQGDIGLGESYTRGEWDSPDITALLEWFLSNKPHLPKPGLFARGFRVLERARHWLRRNHKDNSRRNIAAHYDLGNDFYQSFLDPTMLYSAAYFPTLQHSLEEAQYEKMRRLAERLNLNPQSHVLEIGCGWGAFACFLARNYGCRVTAITLSKEQHKLATERVLAEKLTQRVQVQLTDYRDLDGQFDAIASIEMLEAVGHRYLPVFFGQCERLLAPGGRLAVQVITSSDAGYQRYRRSVDWMRKHIFPGGHLPSVGALQRAMEEASTFSLAELESFSAHYAETLRRWRDRFGQNWNRIHEQGFDETFRRAWVYYLHYCEAGFATRNVEVVQALYRRANDCIHYMNTIQTTQNSQPALSS